MNRIQLFMIVIIFTNITYFIINSYNDFTLNTVLISIKNSLSSDDDDEISSCHSFNKNSSSSSSSSKNSRSGSSTTELPKIFCLILTKPDNFHTKALAAYKTWAHKCDGYRFISVIPDDYKYSKKHVINKIVYKSTLKKQHLNSPNNHDQHHRNDYQIETFYNYDLNNDHNDIVTAEFESLANDLNKHSSSSSSSSIVLSSLNDDDPSKPSSSSSHSAYSSSPYSVNSLPITNSIELVSLNYTILQPAGLLFEKYSKLTDKVYYAIIDVYKRFKNDYDWFIKADDDTFIFMDNLKEFLKDKNECSPLKYGYNFQIILKWQCGGAGYVLSKESFRRVASKLIDDYKFCPNTGIEDKDISRCLRKLNVLSGISLDEKNRERFHHTNIYSNYKGIQDFHIKLYSQNTPKKGLECCSDSSISFHYESPDEMYKLARIIDDYKAKGIKLNFKNVIEELNIDKF